MTRHRLCIDYADFVKSRHRKHSEKRCIVIYGLVEKSLTQELVGANIQVFSVKNRHRVFHKMAPSGTTYFVEKMSLAHFSARASLGFSKKWDLGFMMIK